MIDSQQFVPDSDDEATVADIEAGLLRPWRVSADGVQWYRRVGDIHGVTPDDDDPRTGWWGWFRGLLDGDSDDDD